MPHDSSSEELLAKRLGAVHELREKIAEAWTLRNPGSTIEQHPEYEQFVATVVDVSLASTLGAAKLVAAKSLLTAAREFDYLHAYPGHIIQHALATYAENIVKTERDL